MTPNPARWLDALARPARFIPHGSAASGGNESSGDELLDRIADGEALARHVVRQNVTVAGEDLVRLTGARADIARLRQDAEAMAGWFATVTRVAQAVGQTPGELIAAEQRVRRLAPELGDALHLLRFATSKGSDVDAEVTKPILEAANAAEAGTLSANQEQAFVDAYRTLAAKLAPVTAATLLASQTRLPKLLDLFRRPRRFVADLANITLGRFVHSVVFTIVLLCTGATIAYQTMGEAALARYDAIGKRLDELPVQYHKAKAIERERRNALLALLGRKDTKDEDKRLADERLTDAIDEVQELERRQRELEGERLRLPTTLATWAGQPCKPALWSWSCAFSLATKDMQPEDREIVFDAEMVLKRLNVVVLPMLLGLLGAYSFVLRSISREIRERSYEEHSLLHHVVRLSLGALAGIAAGWVLKPEQVGLLNSVPSWVLAFVAGYGIELLFTFLDRIVSSFASQQGNG